MAMCAALPEGGQAMPVSWKMGAWLLPSRCSWLDHEEGLLPPL